MTAVRIVRKIEQVDPEQWDRLAAANPMMSHGWLRVVEREWLEDIERLYFVLEAGGELRAAAACGVETSRAGLESLDDLLLGRLSATLVGRFLSFRPSLVCGFPWNIGPGLLSDPGASVQNRRELTSVLVDAIRQESRRRGYAAAFLSVPHSDAVLRSLLAGMGCNSVRHEPVFALDVRWQSFDDYRRSLASKNMRENIRRELNLNRRRGVEIRELEEVHGLEDRLYELVDGHYRRYGWPAFPFGRGWFRALKSRLGPDAVIAVAIRGETVMGVTVSLRKQRSFQMILACVDHVSAGNDMTYFNLSYYWPLRMCIACGDRRYVAGPGQALARLRRGYQPVESEIHYLPANRTGRVLCRAWLPLLARWLNRKRGFA